MFKHHGFSPAVLYAFDLDFICNFQGQGQYGGIRYVGVNHNGINFLTRERSLVEDYLDVVEHHKLVSCNYLSVFIMIYSHWQKNFTFWKIYVYIYFLFSFEDIIDVVLPTKDTVQINLKSKSVVLFTNRVGHSVTAPRHCSLRHCSVN